MCVCMEILVCGLLITATAAASKNTKIKFDRGKRVSKEISKEIEREKEEKTGRLED